MPQLSSPPPPVLTAGAVVSCVMKAVADSESGVGFVFDAVWKCGVRKEMNTSFSGQFMQIIS